jgi:hypothetical protein
MHRLPASPVTWQKTLPNSERFLCEKTAPGAPFFYAGHLRAAGAFTTGGAGARFHGVVRAAIFLHHNCALLPRRAGKTLMLAVPVRLAWSLR